MKHLLIMRHGQPEHGGVDYERTLAPEGEQYVARLGKMLSERKFNPDIIMSSPSKRTGETAELIAGCCGHTRDVDYRQEFYNCTRDTILDGIRALDDSVERVLVVGHNPSVESLVSLLCSGNIPGGTWSFRMPAGGLAWIEVESDSWAGTSQGSCRIFRIVTPENINNECSEARTASV